MDGPLSKDEALKKVLNGENYTSEFKIMKESLIKIVDDI